MRDVAIFFEGIDDYNRPIFVERNTLVRFGDTDNLFAWNTSKEDVLLFYRKQNKPLRCLLTIFGKRFNCEPMGIPVANDVNLILADNE